MDRIDRLVVLKVMPDDKSTVVVVSQRAELDYRDIGSPEGPLDCITVNEIRVHGRVINRMPDERLHCAMINKTPFAVLPCREQRSRVTIGNDGSAAVGNNLEHVVVSHECRGRAMHPEESHLSFWACARILYLPGYG